MSRRLVEIFRPRDLGYLAKIHHHDAIADVLDDSQIMCDKEIGKPELVLKIHQQVEHLGLDRHVQCRNRLVTDDEPRVQDQRPCNANALSLPTTEFVRIAIHHDRIESDALHYLRDTFSTFGIGTNVLQQQRFCNDVSHGHPWIQGRERVLEHDLELSSHRSELLRGHLCDVQQAATQVVPNGSRSRLNQAQEAAPGRGLPTAALADQAQRLATPYLETHVIHCANVPHRALQQALLDGEELAQMRYVHQDVLTVHYASPLCSQHLANCPFATSNIGGSEASQGGNA